MTDAVKGDWVQISNVVLPAGSRAPQVPEDTQKCDLMMWVKGFLQSDANLGDEAEVETVTGRKVRGKLCLINPAYTHTYGQYVPELTKIQAQLRSLIKMGGEQ